VLQKLEVRKAIGFAIEAAQTAIARDVPVVSLWYKTNVAVLQPDIHGVRLSPIADFAFLKDVFRSAR
jgi:hypothetical protein